MSAAFQMDLLDMQSLIVSEIIPKATESGETRRYNVPVTKEIKKYIVATDKPKDIKIVPSPNELGLTVDDLVGRRGYSSRNDLHYAYYFFYLSQYRRKSTFLKCVSE